MAKLTIKSRFWIAPTEVLNNPDLTFKAKGLYTFLQSKPDSWKFSAKRISQQTKDWIDGVNSWLQELEKSWLLERKKYQNEKGQFDIEYILYETIGENPVREEKTIRENPVLENPVLENPLTYSKIEPSKIDNSKKESSSSKIFINKKEKILEITHLAKYKEIQEKYLEFRKDRKEKRKPITSRAEVLLFWKLKKIPKNISEKHQAEIAIKMFEIAIESWWSSIFYKESIAQQIIKKDTVENRKKVEQQEEIKKRQEHDRIIKEKRNYFIYL